MATLIISNKKMKDIFKIVIYLEDSSLMIKGARETFGNEAKKIERWCFIRYVTCSFILEPVSKQICTYG